MSDTDATSNSPFDGGMFLYDQPELLTKEMHGNLGLSATERPFEFVKDVKGLPLVCSEVQSAQKHYPVVFSEFENPVLVSIVGIVDDRNLFVDSSGHWDNTTYVPSYVRCHPFALARRPDDEFAVVIDRSCANISDTPDIPFFDGDEMSAGTRSRVDFCGQYNQERKRTNDFCKKVKELGLLTGQRVAQTLSNGEEERVADYVTVDPEKLTNLDKDVLQELHMDGSLSVIYGQLFSLENWNRIIMRRNRLLTAN